MKYIDQNSIPASLQNWRAHALDIQVNYDCLKNSPDVTRDIIENRIADQGAICPYTLIRISKLRSTSGEVYWNAHLEHVYPQSRSERDFATDPNAMENTVSYRNLLACFPEDSSFREFGARFRENHLLKVTPFESHCESLFVFDLGGKVTGKTPNACETIGILNLNHDRLINRRRSALGNEGVTIANPVVPGRRPRLNFELSASDARARASQVMQRDSDGQFTQFCMAIRDGLLLYADRKDKDQKKRAIARRQY